MTGPPRTPPGASLPGEDAQSSETAGDPLEWQNELDVAIADIDSRLRHPRRRATDVQPAAARRGGLTMEVIDEIAWRVAELLRGDGGPPVTAIDVAAAISKTVKSSEKTAARPTASRQPAPLPPPIPEPKQLPPGIALTLRIRKPFFRLPWPFRRRRRQRMIMFSDYRVS
jgi:hypothetical protein